MRGGLARLPEDNRRDTLRDVRQLDWSDSAFDAVYDHSRPFGFGCAVENTRIKSERLRADKRMPPLGLYIDALGLITSERELKYVFSIARKRRDKKWRHAE